MHVTPEILLFALFAVVSVVFAGLTVMLRNPVKSALSLVGCFFCLACLYILQRAELLGVLEVLVYAGAIMVLFVFVIMLVEEREEMLIGPDLGSRIAVPLKIGGAALLAFTLIAIVRRAGLPAPQEIPADFGSVRGVGHEFFDNYLFHFELTSVLLLAGIVGAVAVSMRKRGS